ncbi:MAG: hypothetical protein QM221_08525 [Bacillota bacterium]|nr:hypothetical protein [Bacillota bacterium]
MSRIVLSIMAIFGVMILLYYIFMIVSGKRFARLVKTKDRFIWNGLKNVSDASMPYANRNNTIFLDPSNLVISPDSIVRMSTQIRNTGALEDALVIPYEKIVSFDFDSSLKDSNLFLRFLTFLFNRLFKVNNYSLTLTFFDQQNTLKEMKFRARNMDARDFELAFADFDNRIYTGRMLIAQEEKKGSFLPYTGIEEDPTIPPETAGFTLDDEEISVLEQTIYLPEDLPDEQATTILSQIPMEESGASSEDTVVIHQPAIEADEDSAQEELMPQEVQQFSLDESELEEVVPLSDEMLREKMREFTQKDN